MLRERILTALVLLALLVPAVLAGSPLPFALLTLVMIAAAGWEWARLCRRTLAAGISPGKSWEGVYSGLVAAVVLALSVAWLAADGTNLYAVLRARAGWIGLVLASMLLVALSIVGDLCESLAKRAVGA